MRLMGDEAHIAHASVANIHLDELSKVDDLTLVVPLKSSNARLIDSFVQQNTVIVQDGATDYTNPVGTGPVQVPGVQRSASAASASATRTTGTRASRTSTSGRTSRSTTSPRA